MNVYLGAGSDRKEGYIHVDMVAFPGIDIVADVTKGVLEIETSSVDKVFTQDFLEHIPPEKTVTVINEIWRILKHDGIMEHYVPNAGSKNDFGSPSHLSHWNLQTFEHFDVNSYRYNLDHVYEGFVGKFSKALAEEITFNDEYGIKKPQSIHVIYYAIK
jgi:SAM-dependent methyltransferase